MFLRSTVAKSGEGKLRYWKLVENYATERGTRQRVVAHLGKEGELHCSGEGRTLPIGSANLIWRRLWSIGSRTCGVAVPGRVRLLGRRSPEMNWFRFTLVRLAGEILDDSGMCMWRCGSGRGWDWGIC